MRFELQASLNLYRVTCLRSQIENVQLNLVLNAGTTYALELVGSG